MNLGEILVAVESALQVVLNLKSDLAEGKQLFLDLAAAFHKIGAAFESKAGIIPASTVIPPVLPPLTGAVLSPALIPEPSVLSSPKIGI